MRTLVKEPEGWRAGGYAAGWQLQEMCVCVYIRARTLKGGQRWNRRGWQEIIKRLMENKCLENRIKNNSARRLRMKLGAVGMCFLSRLLLLCRWELRDCDEKTGVRPRRKQSRSGQFTHKSGWFLKRTKRIFEKDKSQICKLSQQYCLPKYILLKLPGTWQQAFNFPIVSM